MKNREKNPPKCFFLPSSLLWQGCLMACDEHTEATWLSSPPQTCTALASTCPGQAAVTWQELLPTTTEHPARSHLPVYELPAPRWQPGPPGKVHHKALQQGAQIRSLLPPSSIFPFNMTLQVRLGFSLMSQVIIQSFYPMNIMKKFIL